MSYVTEAPLHHIAPRKSLIVALQIAKRFGGRRPTIEQLRSAFGMSRATAYRWRAAWDYVEGA